MVIKGLNVESSRPLATQPAVIDRTESTLLCDRKLSLKCLALRDCSVKGFDIIADACYKKGKEMAHWLHQEENVPLFRDDETNLSVSKKKLYKSRKQKSFRKHRGNHARYS